MSESMSDIPSPLDFDPDPDLDDDEYLEELEEFLERAQDKNDLLRNKLRQSQLRIQELENENERFKQENATLKSSPSYVATVKEIVERDESGVALAVIKQSGNNQEILTEVPRTLDIEAGDRVAVNDSFGPQRILEQETDARTKAMEVDESPDVTYDQIGGLEGELKEVREAVEQPLNNRERFDEVGIDPPSGVLLYGPPGTGKTLMAKAIAKEADAAFIRLAGSELVQKFIGEGAQLVRDLFRVAKQNSPAIIFIDEIDAIASKRTEGKTSGDAEVQRTMMQLLSEMDGFEDRGDVRIMAATNRFDMLDDAILRPGRFDRLIEVSLPDETGREHIFKIHTREMSIDDDVDFSGLAESTDGLTGADIEAVCTEAGMEAIRDERKSVNMEDFLSAVGEVRSDNEDDSTPPSRTFA